MEIIDDNIEGKLRVLDIKSVSLNLRTHFHPKINIFRSFFYTFLLDYI